MSERVASTLALALALTLTVPTSASAWCPSRTQGPPQPVDYSACAPDAGRFPLVWQRPCTSLSLSSAAPPRSLSTDQVTAILRRGLDQWQDADCGSGVTPGLGVEILTEPNVCAAAMHNSSGRNVHSVMFIQDAEVWSDSLELAPNAFAVTFAWHRASTGEIQDVDMLINESRGDYLDCPDTGCGDCPPEGCGPGGPIDLGNIVTHELGHYFGISHTTREHPDATMYAEAPPGEILKRDLEPDDVDAICSTYPPGAFDDTCDHTPEGGLGLDCRAPDGCGCRAPGSGRSGGWGVALFAIALEAVRARRRGRARRPRGGSAAVRPASRPGSGRDRSGRLDAIRS